MKKRKSRLPLIVDILTNNHIKSQEDLSKELVARGISVTQATLSRDLKTLRTTKVATDDGSYRYIVADPSRADIGNDNMGTPKAKHPTAQSIAISGNVVVIKTRNGYASGLAYDIDMMKSEHILGTIPGSDTVFAIVNENSSRQEIFDTFASTLPERVMKAARVSFLGEQDS